MTYPSFILKFTVVAALLAAAALSAQASVLYFDDFDGDASQPLLGTRPDVSFNAASWRNSSVKSPFNAAGGSLSGDRGGAVWLPISLEPNAVYQLTVTELEPRSNRVAIGFADTNANSIHYHLRLQARAWLYARISNAELEMLIGPGMSNKAEQSPEFFVPAALGDGVADYRISIDTFESPWTVEFSAKSHSAKEWTLLGSGPMPATAVINYVGISELGDAAQLNHVGSFELRKLGKKVEIPERGTYALLAGLVGLGCVLVRRLKVLTRV